MAPEEDFITRALCLLSTVMTEQREMWADVCELEGEEFKPLAVLFDVLSDGSYLVLEGDPPRTEFLEKDHQNHILVGFSFSSRTGLVELMQGACSLQSAVHSGDIRIEGGSRESLFVSQMMGEVWNGTERVRA